MEFYVKYIDISTNELTNGFVYKVEDYSFFGTLTTITINNDLNIKKVYLLNQCFIDITKEYLRDNTIDGILS